jgi:LysM repeat protein
MTYTVVPGDTGEKIAEKFTGAKNRWPELLTVNPALKDPTYGIRLYAGRTINLPPSWTAAAPTTPTSTTEIEAEKKGLSTGAIVGIAAGGALVVGGAIYIATRKSGKTRSRSRRK